MDTEVLIDPLISVIGSKLVFISIVVPTFGQAITAVDKTDRAIPCFRLFELLGRNHNSC